MWEIFFPLIVGLLGSLHCVGMCGPLVVAYSLHLRGRGAGNSDRGDLRGPDAPRGRDLWMRGTAHHVAFHAGRILTYSLLGGLAAALAHMAGLPGIFAGLRSSVTLSAGILMIIFGLVILKIFPVSFFALPSLAGRSFFGRIFPPLFSSGRAGSRFMLGIGAGFLPCMLSWAMIAKAATSQNPAAGFWTMALFGLGTSPVLFAAGLPASLLSLRARLFGERAAACAVIIMGFILVFKGAKYFA